MAVFHILKLCFLVSLLLVCSANFNGGSGGGTGGGGGFLPPTCNRIECPTYDVIASGNEFEIRRYNSTMWVSTQPIVDVSLVHAGNIAFFQLFDYIQGKNDNHKKIEMTAPVIIEVMPSDGPFCASSFVVSFYIPKENQATAPFAEGLRLQKWGRTYVAVRQFSGFVMDDELGKEAAALHETIAGTVWLDAIEKSHSGSNATEYVVAQYNSPFEFRDRVNEIWLTFDLEENGSTYPSH